MKIQGRRVGKVIGLLMAVLALTSCALLERQMGEASLDSYLQGCIYRGVEQGIERPTAKALRQCHVDAAIQKTSQKEFLDAASRLAKASKEERLSGALAIEISLVKDSFVQCKVSMGIQL